MDARSRVVGVPSEELMTSRNMDGEVHWRDSSISLDDCSKSVGFILCVARVNASLWMTKTHIQ